MQTKYAISLAVLIGAGLGVSGVSAIRAQPKAPPPAFVIAEIDVSNQEGYAKEYLPPASKALLDNGAHYLARGGKTVSIKGEPPKRIVVLSFESLEKAQAAFASPAFSEAAKIGEQYAKFRIYAAEGIPQ
jgi:uncharacterized protein (DUF1330 family)